MAIDREEIESNAFAASLLMPSAVIREQLQRLDLPSDRPLIGAPALADVFKVSAAAMGFRLISLGLVSH